MAAPAADCIWEIGTKLPGIWGEKKALLIRECNKLNLYLPETESHIKDFKSH